MKRERKGGDRNETNEATREGKRDEEWAHSARIAARAQRWEKVLSGTPDRMCAASRKRRCSLLMWFMGRRMPFTSRGPSWSTVLPRPLLSHHPSALPPCIRRTYRIDRVLFYLFAERKKARTPLRRVFMRPCASHRCVTQNVMHHVVLVSWPTCPTPCAAVRVFGSSALGFQYRRVETTPRARASRFDSS